MFANASTSRGRPYTGRHPAMDFRSVPATSADDIELVSLPSRAAIPASNSDDFFGDTISEEILLPNAQASSIPTLLPAPVTHAAGEGQPRWMTVLITICCIGMFLGLSWAIAAIIIWTNGGFVSN
jgi:hypothetical protein